MARRLLPEPLTVVTWLWTGWRDRYTPAHVHALRDMVAEHLKRKHRFLCITDKSASQFDCDTFPLWDDPQVPNRPGHHDSYRRLKMFSPWAVEAFDPGQVLSMDLDALVVGEMDPLISGHDVRLMRGGVSHYNGSMWLHRLGTRPQVWTDFHPVRSIEQTRGLRNERTGRLWAGSDQVWLSYKLGPGEAVYSGKEHGCWRWDRKQRQLRAFPDNSRVLFFYGGEEAKPWSDETARGQPFVHERYMQYLERYT